MQKNKLAEKKGIAQLVNLALGIVIFTVIVSAGALLLEEFADEVSDGIQDNESATAAENATREGLSGLNSLAGFTTIIAIIGVIAFIVVFLVASFRGIGGGSATL